MESDSPTRRVHWLMLLGIVMLAGVVRLAELQREPLWLDELWSVQLSSGRGSTHLEIPANRVINSPPMTTPLAGADPWYTVWSRMESATHPPLYFVLLRLWRETFGEGDSTARMLSVLASLGAIALLFDSIRRLHPPAVALWAAGIMALAPQDIEYARQVRNYAMLILLAMVALNSLVRIEQRGVSPMRAIALSLSAAGMLLTHYFAVGAFAAMGFDALLRLRGRARVIIVAALVAAAMIFILTWGPFLLRHTQRFDREEMTVAFVVRHEGGLWWPIWFAASIPVRLLTAVPKAPLWQYTAAAVGAVGFLIIPVMLIWRGRRELVLWMLWTVSVIGAVAILDAARSTLHLWFGRYTVLAGPGVYALAAAVAWGARRWLRHLVPAGALLLGLIALPRAYASLTPAWPAVASAVEASVGPREIIVFAAPGENPWTNAYMYLAYSHYARDPLRPVVLLNEPPSEALLAELRAAPRVWLVLAGGSLSPVQVLPGFGASGGYIDPPVSLWEMQPGSVEDVER